MPDNAGPSAPMTALPLPGHHPAAVRLAYEAAGTAYDRYADGEGADPLCFDGPHAEADRRVWREIDAHLVARRDRGQRELRVLDVGCGPGSWLCRVTARAAALGFAVIELHGLDLAASSAERARARVEAAARYHRRPATRTVVCIEAGDAVSLLPRQRRPFDLVLCLFSVMNHLAAPDRVAVAAELGRLARGRLLVSVRAAGSPPTIYIDRLDRARAFRQHADADRLAVDLLDGTHLDIPSHLFRAGELDALFRPHAIERSVIGLDLFHARFTADTRWNAPSLDHDAAFNRRLDALEAACEADPDLIDHATHLLLRADAPARAVRAVVAPTT